MARFKQDTIKADLEIVAEGYDGNTKVVLRVADRVFTPLEYLALEQYGEHLKVQVRRTGNGHEDPEAYAE